MSHILAAFYAKQHTHHARYIRLGISRIEVFDDAYPLLLQLPHACGSETIQG